MTVDWSRRARLQLHPLTFGRRDGPVTLVLARGQSDTAPMARGSLDALPTSPPWAAPRQAASAASTSAPGIPLFVCHANCCRSVLASYLYRHLCPATAVLSAGLEPGERTSDTALAMLAHWGVDATGHQPTKLDRRRCEEASAIFVMAPPYVRRLLLEYGHDLANKTYLYGEPFSRPASFGAEHTVPDPSFDPRPTRELVEQFSWMRERTLQIRQSLLEHGRPLVAAASYLNLLEAVDPYGH